jgi:hypothetical protein
MPILFVDEQLQFLEDSSTHLLSLRLGQFIDIGAADDLDSGSHGTVGEAD